MDDDVQDLIRQVFEACNEITRRTGRPVSPDGHLVGSLGEIFAAQRLELELMPPSTRGYDAIDSQGRKVEIKTTTRRSIAFSANDTQAERLVVVILDELGNGHIAYDGLMKPALDAAGPQQSNGQRTLTLSKIIENTPGPGAEPLHS